MNKIRTRQDLIRAYVDYFKSKEHKEIPSSSLVPENDPTVLFTAAGMHPLVPFILGQPHPLGKRICNVQKCVRTGDIEETGDTVHHTFFEMLGNWSLGDYFKEDAIKMSFEFLTKILKIPVDKLAVSCFKGDKDAEKDEESEKIWLSLGIPKERIAFLPKENNWWGPAGETGPCGPDTEMFYYTGKKAPKKFDDKDKNWVEIWNDVFMQYNKTKSGFLPLKQKNVDTGMGVERTLAVLNGLDDNYLSSIFLPIIKEIEKITGKKYGKDEEDTRAMRIICDHIRAATFILGDEKGIKPSNVGQGYVLRRLIRRAIRYGKLLGIKDNFTSKIAIRVIEDYQDYDELKKNRNFILTQLDEEENKFNKTLEDGIKEAEKLFSRKKPIEENKFNKLMESKKRRELMVQSFQNRKAKRDYSIKEFKITEKEIEESLIGGRESFLLYQSYGFPLEMIDEMATVKRLLVEHYEFRDELEKHQELSRTSSSGQFKSGLADNSEQTRKLHTATHMLNEALRRVLKENVKQKGSNINPERLRFDFNFPRKLTDQEINETENLVNKKIQENLEVKREELPLNKALDSGAQGEFGAKYPEIVSVYTILDKTDKRGYFSKEICTGPHVNNTKEIGHFKIIKEESVAAGIRRIKAIAEQ